MEVKCNLCNSNDYTEWFQMSSEKFYKSPSKIRDVYTIIKCNSCGLVYVKEPVTEAELADIYSEGYYEGRDAAGYASYSHKPSAFEKLSLRVNNLIKNPKKIARLKYFIYRKFLLKTNKSKDLDMIQRAVGKRGKLLDVGSAKGTFLDVARNEGWDVTGVELSEYGAAFSRDHLNLNVYAGTLYDAINSSDIEKSSFDVVTLWDALEHLTDPAALLKNVNYVLKDGGWFFFSTVNIDSLLSKMQGKDWHFFRPPKHLYYYSEETLKQYLSNAGLTVELDDDFRSDIIVLGARKNKSVTNND